MSDIADRIQLNQRRSSEFVDGVVLSDVSIEQIIQSERGYLEEIATLNSRNAELEAKVLKLENSLQKVASAMEGCCSECKSRLAGESELSATLDRLVNLPEPEGSDHKCHKCGGTGLDINRASGHYIKCSCWEGK